MTAPPAAGTGTALEGQRVGGNASPGARTGWASGSSPAGRRVFRSLLRPELRPGTFRRKSAARVTRDGHRSHQRNVLRTWRRHRPTKPCSRRSGQVSSGWRRQPGHLRAGPRRALSSGAAHSVPGWGDLRRSGSLTATAGVRAPGGRLPSGL